MTHWAQIDDDAPSLAAMPKVADTYLRGKRSDTSLFDLAGHGLQVDELLREYHCVGYPLVKNGEIGIREDGLIHVSCEEGPLDMARYRLIIAPKPADAPYRYGWVTLSVDDLEKRLLDAGYADVQDADILKMKVGYDQGRFNIVDVAVGIGRMLDKNPRIWQKVGMKRAEILETVLRPGDGYGHWAPKNDRERILAKALLDEVWPEWKAPRTSMVYDGRREIQQLFGLRTVACTEEQASVMLVPKWMFECMTKLVNMGWGPLTPFWIGSNKDQYNGRYDAGCGGGVIRQAGPREQGKPERRMGARATRIFKNCTATYNLHIPDYAWNRTDLEPGPEWDDKYRETCEALAEGCPYDYRTELREAMGLQACRDIPIVVATKDRVHYWRVRSMERTGLNHTVISVVDQDGLVLTDPRPVPKPIEEVEATHGDDDGGGAAGVPDEEVRTEDVGATD